MNELLNEMMYNDYLEEDYQMMTRTKLRQIMANRPMSASAYARAIGLSPITLRSFLNGALLSFASISKLDRYVQDQK